MFLQICQDIFVNYLIFYQKFVNIIMKNEERRKLEKV